MNRSACASNILIAVGAGIAVLAVVGLYLGSRDKPDPVAEAMAQDDSIRKTVAAQNRPPSEAEMNAMAERHPEMLYIPPGSFLQGRLHQEDVNKTAACPSRSRRWSRSTASSSTASNTRTDSRTPRGTREGHRSDDLAAGGRRL